MLGELEGPRKSVKICTWYGQQGPCQLHRPNESDDFFFGLELTKMREVVGN